jgi:hypothetical protein
MIVRIGDDHLLIALATSRLRDRSTSVLVIGLGQI